jgi:hypothetical protein
VRKKNSENKMESSSSFGNNTHGAINYARGDDGNNMINRSSWPTHQQQMLSKKFTSPKRKLFVEAQSSKKSNVGSYPTISKNIEDFQNFVESSKKNNAANGVNGITPLNFHLKTKLFALDTTGNDTSSEEVSLSDSNCKTSVAHYTPCSSPTPANNTTIPFNRSNFTNSETPRSDGLFSALKFGGVGHHSAATTSYVDRFHFSSDRRRSQEAAYDDGHNSPVDSADTSFADDVAGANEQNTPAGLTAGNGGPCLVDGSGVMGRLSDLHVSRRGKFPASTTKSGAQKSTPQAFRELVSADSMTFHKEESPLRLSEPFEACDVSTQSANGSFIDRTVNAVKVDRRLEFCPDSVEKSPRFGLGNDTSGFGPARLFGSRGSGSKNDLELSCSDDDYSEEEFAKKLSGNRVAGKSLADISSPPLSSSPSNLAESFYSPGRKPTRYGPKGHALVDGSPDFGTPVPHAGSPNDIDGHYVLDVDVDAGGRGRSLLLSPAKQNTQFGSDGSDEDEDFLSSNKNFLGSSIKATGVVASSSEGVFRTKRTNNNDDSALKGPKRSPFVDMPGEHEDCIEGGNGYDPYDVMIDHISNASSNVVLETSGCSSISDVSLSRSVNRSPAEAMFEEQPTVIISESQADSSHGSVRNSFDDVYLSAESTDSMPDSDSFTTRVNAVRKLRDQRRASNSSLANSSTSSLPVPDQSAFDHSMNISHLSDSSLQQCPPTPVRNPNWAQESNLSGSITHKTSSGSKHRKSTVPPKAHSHQDLFSDENSKIRTGHNHNMSRTQSFPANRIHRSNSLEESKVLVVQSENEFDTSSDINFFNDFVVEGFLGSGAFAEVFKARDRAGNLYAVKKNNRQFRSRKDREWLLHEVRCMKKLGQEHCDNLIQLVKAWQEGGYFFVQLDFADRGTVADLLHFVQKSDIMLKETTILQIIHDVANGLDHIHRHRLVHMDIKPANLLLASPGIVKIGDFGMCVAEGAGDDGDEGDTRFVTSYALFIV